MSQLSALGSAKTLSDLAILLAVKPAALSYVLYKKEATAKYTTFAIPKRGGGTRTISAPASDLKLMQRRLSDLLQNCAHDIDVANGVDDRGKHPDRLAHGFKRHRSILTNAKQHRARRFVFNVDLSDFFGSINFGRVRGFFIKNRSFSLDPKVATVIAQIACHENKLPQGAPCSPVISNFIAHILDIELSKLAAKCECVYSRYADDLTFSTNRPAFPVEIARLSETDPHRWAIGLPLMKILVRHGFQVTEKKTRMQYRDSRQDVTGLVVNRKLNAPKQYRHTVRAMVHRLLTKGEFHLSTPEGVATGTKAQLKGMLAFISQVDAYNKELQKDQPTQTAMPHRGHVFRDFILFDLFTSKNPVLVCEGKTDYVYITHAIRSLADSFPQLVAKDEKGETRLALALFRYAGRSVGRELQLGDGGVGSLGKFLTQYREATQNKFRAKGGDQPVILLVDCDDKGTKFLEEVQKHSGKKAPSGEVSFVHALSNLYVVPIPKMHGAKHTTIEDLFDQKTLETKVDGKPFDKSNKSNNGASYGKSIFAYKVVQPNANEIDFAGFKPLLQRIVAVLTEHKSKHHALMTA